MNRTGKDNIESRIIEFLTSGKPIDDDFKTLIKKNAENSALFNEYLDIWQSSLVAGKKDSYNKNAAWANIKSKIVYKKNPDLFIVFQKIAAVAILFFCISFVSFKLLTKKDQNFNSASTQEYYVPYGSRSQVKLPDGSLIWLNAGSSLKFNGQFGQKNRNIFLEGEAFFDVTKNEKIPFVVKTKAVTVEVLGTSFNVKAYPEEKTIETIVTRGEVKVFKNSDFRNHQNSKVLKKNQKVTYYKAISNVSSDKLPQKSSIHNKTNEEGSFETICEEAMPEKYISWKDSRWYIEREELYSLAIKLQRRFNVSIIIKDELLQHYIFSGLLEDETLEQVLEAIKLTAPINYTINEDKVFLTYNNFFKPDKKLTNKQSVPMKN